jgi:hypothetical protein
MRAFVVVLILFTACNPLLHLAAQTSSKPEANSVQVARAVLLATKAAVCRRLCIVNAVLDRGNTTKVGEGVFEFAVREVLEQHGIHDGLQLPSTHLSAANDLDKQLFIIVRDAGSVGCQVCAGGVTDDFSSGEQADHGLFICISQCMAVVAFLLDNLLATREVLGRRGAG